MKTQPVEPRNEVADSRRLSFGRDGRRRGAIILLSAFTLVMAFAFAAFSIDVGFITLTRAQMQNVADAAVLSAVLELNPNEDQSAVMAAAKQAARDVAVRHRAGDWDSFELDVENDVEFGRSTYDPNTDKYTYQWGSGAVPYNVVRVNARRTIVTQMDEQGNSSQSDRRLPLFFGPVIGHTHAPLQVSAIATFQPRDIMLVLDYSASMNDDSELRSIYTVGQGSVETSIHQMWDDLDQVTYGNLDFWPDWVTVPGETYDFDATWRTSVVDVESADTMDQVRLYFSNGNHQTFAANTTSGTWEGTGSNAGSRVTKVRVYYGSDHETIDFYSNSDVIRGLGLDGVAYPYPSGSWSDFVEYCRSHSSSMPNYDYDVYAAGYRRKFGMLTLINYWNKSKPLNSQTPDLWKVSQQPIQSLKDSVDVLFDYLRDVEAEDKIGLSVYTYPSSPHAVLESGLTEDYESLRTISHHRQAGHYDYYTNIGAGMRTGRLELEANARPRAQRLMVLMTDGLANRTSTSASPSQFALDEADLAAAAGVKIVTVSLGAGADTELMQQIADRTGGEHFNVPGGQSVADYADQLRAVFQTIAAARPLKLISAE